MEFLIVSGLSGAGKSAVIKDVEDMGYYAVDNMPVALIPAFADLYVRSSIRDRQPYERVALVTDVRAGQTFDALFESLELIRAMNCDYKILFVESNTQAILLRYKETRRRHPLRQDGETLQQAIEREKTLLSPVRESADYIIDTSDLTHAQRREYLNGLLAGSGKRRMVVTVTSFGFKYGLPTESDLVFDVRFLPNPYYIAELRPLTGLDDSVREFIDRWPETQEFCAKLTDLVHFLLPRYQEEGKSSLSIAVGCTGGRHRSVRIARALYDDLSKKGCYVVLTHRDIARDSVREAL